jgi:hypothetical protein
MKRIGLRSYPVPFGLHIQLIRPLLAQKANGCPTVDDNVNAPELFQASPWGDEWEEADLLAACVWVRGSKHLEVSPRWKSVFPTGLPLI